MFRKFELWTMKGFLAAVAVQRIEGKKTSPVSSSDSDDLSHFQCRPSDLPLYAPLHSYNKPKRMPHLEKSSAARETLENAVQVVRSELQAGLHMANQQKANLDEYLHIAKQRTQSTVDYLNEPQNILPRTGAIAIGGLAGFIFGARGGFIKKFLYTTIGAGAVASLCYPRQAEQFTQDALYQARKVYAIAYNFVKGVKPGEEVPIEPINKFPTSLEDVKYLVYDLYDEAKDAVFPKKK
uniref:MICOS complex subunit n=1 Tax=Glossina brevipalpis TaxID=37001 RepID=A0A1A9W3V0_9MUSC